MMILITGARGFIGRSLTAALTRAERPFHIYDERINNPLALRAQLEGMTTVIHLAGAEARGSVRQLQHIDVEGTERLIEESRRAGVEHLIVVSRLNADPNAIYPLLRAKGEVERLVQRGGIPYTILRSATLFGRHDRFLNVIDRLLAWSWPFAWLPNGGRVAMQPLWVEDFVRCLMATVDRPDLVGKTLSLAGEERLHYREIVQELLLATGRRRLFLSPRLILLRIPAMWLYGWRLRPPVSRFFMDRFSVPDITALDSVLYHFGFRPQRMSETIGYLRRPGFRL